MGKCQSSGGLFVINKTVQRVSIDGESKIVVDVPKTESSVRTVFMPDFLTEIMSDFKRSPSIYVLSGLNVPKEPRILQYRFKKVLKDCGIKRSSISCAQTHIRFRLH